MEFKGTKGEWLVRATGKNYNSNRIDIIKENDNSIAWVIAQDLYNKDIEQIANAKLIAAAPKLLSALQHAITGLEWRKDEPPTAFDKADDEKLHEWKELINQIL